MNMLKQVGYTNGDKGTKGLPNMKVGEFRYYIKDNPNVDRMTGRTILSGVFIRVMTCLFPEYYIESEDGIDGRKNVWGVGDLINDFYKPLVINKGYICIKEASSTEEGTIFYLHDGTVLAYKEQYRG